MERQQRLEETFKSNLRDFQNQIGVWVFCPSNDLKKGESMYGKRTA